MWAQAGLSEVANAKTFAGRDECHCCAGSVRNATGGCVGASAALGECKTSAAARLTAPGAAAALGLSALFALAVL